MRVLVPHGHLGRSHTMVLMRPLRLLTRICLRKSLLFRFLALTAPAVRFFRLLAAQLVRKLVPVRAVSRMYLKNRQLPCQRQRQ